MRLILTLIRYHGFKSLKLMPWLVTVCLGMIGIGPETRTCHMIYSQIMSSNRVYSDRIFLVTLVVITILIAIAGGGFFWYYTSKESDFKATYNQLGIQPLPSSVEWQVSSRLAQLHREPCYRDAIIGLGRALLAAGYAREAATSMRSFVRRCGSAPEVLPLAFTGLERINDFSGALEVANAGEEVLRRCDTSLRAVLASVGLSPLILIYLTNRSRRYRSVLPCAV
jgi:AcrR family transcriptional regulator